MYPIFPPFITTPTAYDSYSSRFISGCVTPSSPPQICHTGRRSHRMAVRMSLSLAVEGLRCNTSALLRSSWALQPSCNWTLLALPLPEGVSKIGIVEVCRRCLHLSRPPTRLQVLLHLQLSLMHLGRGLELVRAVTDP